jgi:hypothetical protein
MVDRKMSESEYIKVVGNGNVRLQARLCRETLSGTLKAIGGTDFGCTRGCTHTTFRLPTLVRSCSRTKPEKVPPEEFSMREVKLAVMCCHSTNHARSVACRRS